ncbi:iron-containing alcohol dehydrogenase family protein [Aquibacillus salsiterrae]|uniref:Iron-containing alcohol dehydrogenase family protein n=1 Tax=Aquibacillus salsiterrae TaxID=2950439 RepID=A0A9X3WBX4_9BACI|nr:iron-containing alcohol dehydrogenase family protein [Aquibacillus salsiterrae]MDC3415963.1 iron-containing alcohol dehydrogenase family protein [Aquibacillus salsiterrae]
MKQILIKGSPSIYECYPGVLDTLDQKLAKNDFTKGMLIHGDLSWEAALPFFPRLETPLTKVRYNRECTFQEVERISQIAHDQATDFILGVGGGKVMDIAKACGNETGLPVILIPTLASNCAPWTPLSVFYDEQGNFLHYTIFEHNTFMVLVEPTIIVNSPVSYLRAGIGDTIAKWYEADILTRKLNTMPIGIEIAMHAARLCRDVLLEEGIEAISSVEKREVTTAFTRVIETIIMAGGMVGGYGDHYGRVSGAHSIHNGLTTIPETHPHLHGNKVAYGILVQLAIENRPEEIELLLPFYQQLNLPISITELGITTNQEWAISQIAAAATKEGESIRLMHVTAPHQVEEAIRFVEEIVTR